MDKIGLAGRLQLWGNKRFKVVDSVNTIVNTGLDVCAEVVGRAATFQDTAPGFSYKMYGDSSSINKEDTTPGGTLRAVGSVVSYEVDRDAHSVVLGIVVGGFEGTVTKAALFFGSTLFSEILVDFTGDGETEYSGSWTVYFSPSSVVITATASPSAGGTVTGAGTYEQGKVVTLTAVPNVGYTFNYWNTGETDATISFTASESASYRAYFGYATYTIAVLCDPEEAGTVTGGGVYQYGESVRLTATADTANGFTFSQWSDGSTLSARTITVTGDATYTALFLENQWLVTAVARAEDGSTIDVDFTGTGYYDKGTSVTVTAPRTVTHNGVKYTFLYWSNGSTRLSTSVSYTFTVEGVTNLYAYYEAESAED